MAVKAYSSTSMHPNPGSGKRTQTLGYGSKIKQTLGYGSKEVYKKMEKSLGYGSNIWYQISTMATILAILDDG